MRRFWQLVSSRLRAAYPALLPVSFSTAVPNPSISLCIASLQEIAMFELACLLEQAEFELPCGLNAVLRPPVGLEPGLWEATQVERSAI